MATFNDFPANGKILRVEDGFVVFAPLNTTYELKLTTKKPYVGPLRTPVFGFIRLNGRKLWTVPSGGNFVVPIQGPTRIVQGRIKFVDATTMVVHAGVPVVVTLPSGEGARDLPNGTLEAGRMVNCTIFPGAAFELTNEPAGLLTNA